MAGKILFGESSTIKCPGELEAYAAFRQKEIIRIEASGGGKAILDAVNASGAEAEMIFLPGSLRGNSEVEAALKGSPSSRHSIWVDPPEGTITSAVFSSVDFSDLSRPGVLSLLGVAFDPKRTLGVKTFLKEGSTIYSHSFTAPNGLGSALDRCLDLAKDALELPHALAFWGGINALVADALSMISGKIESGARVEIQIGFDLENLAASVRFPCAPLDPVELSKRILYVPGEGASPWLIAREQANMSELRIYEENGSVEFGVVFSRKIFPQARVRPLIVRQIAKLPLEDAESVARYRFQPFSGLGKKAKGGFKKSFSERIQETKGEAEALTIPPTSEIKAAPAESADLAPWQAKSKGLEDTISQRDHSIARLTKEIEEINDPMKRGVVSGVIDQQKQALAQKLKIAEDALKLANNREKELMGMVDKAIQLKEKLAKDLKIAESKLDQASTGNNSQVVRLQKQLEEANRRSSALSKKITELTEKKVA